MTCDQLRNELGITEEDKKSNLTKTAVGLGVVTAGVVSGGLLLAPMLGFAATTGGITYASIKGNAAYINREREQHLIDVYNEKECGSRIYASNKAEIKRDQDLIKVQRALNEKGYAAGSADGIYGNNTRTALEKFQQDNGLEITGKADDATKNKLLNESVFSSIGDTFSGLSKSDTAEEESGGTTNID